MFILLKLIVEKENPEKRSNYSLLQWVLVPKENSTDIYLTKTQTTINIHVIQTLLHHKLLCHCSPNYLTHMVNVPIEFFKFFSLFISHLILRLEFPCEIFHSILKTQKTLKHHSLLDM